MSMLLHVFHVQNVHSLKPSFRRVKLLQHDVLVRSASCKGSINAAIEHARNCSSQVRKQESKVVHWMLDATEENGREY